MRKSKQRRIAVIWSSVLREHKSFLLFITYFISSFPSFPRNGHLNICNWVKIKWTLKPNWYQSSQASLILSKSQSPAGLRLTPQRVSTLNNWQGSSWKTKRRYLMSQFRPSLLINQPNQVKLLNNPTIFRIANPVNQLEILQSLSRMKYAPKTRLRMEDFSNSKRSVAAPSRPCIKGLIRYVFLDLIIESTGNLRNRFINLLINFWFTRARVYRSHGVNYR